MRSSPRGLAAGASGVLALVALGIWLASSSSSSSSSFSSSFAPLDGPRLTCGEVDVVYTWVNGSDPRHLRTLRRFGKDGRDREPSASRFRDYDTLRYSLRSVRAHFPAARRIHLIVADGEALPVWMGRDDEHIQIVRHSHIMPKRVLPTFNSNAIETNLHLVPGLAECFLYLNDDMILGRETDLSWYFSEGRLNINLGTWMAPYTERVQENNLWHMSVARTNERLNRVYGDASRPYPVHGCYFFHRDVFARMRRIFADSFERTLATRFRTEKDNVVSFMYAHVALNDFGARPSYAYQFYYSQLSSDPEQNWDFLRHLVRRRPLCACINDNLGSDDTPVQASVTQLSHALELMYPDPAPWEKIGPELAPFDERLLTSDSLGAAAFKVLVGLPAMTLAACLTLSALSKLFRVVAFGRKSARG